MTAKSAVVRGREAPEQGEGVGHPPSHDRDFLHFQHVKVAFPCTV